MALIPPSPVGSPFTSYTWADWYEKVRRAINESATISWSQITNFDSGPPLPIAFGGTGTTTPALVAGTNISITGSWPNQTVNSTASGLAAIANLRILANISGGAAVPIANTASAILDATLGSTQGQIITRNASTWTVLNPGTSGYALVSGGAGANLAYAAVMTNPMTTLGDVIVGGASGTPARLAKGTDGAVLISDSTATNGVSWRSNSSVNVAHAFSAQASGSTSVTAAVSIKIALASEVYDTDNAYDTSTSRFTPTLAGYYLFTGQVYTATAAGSYLQAAIYKNGSLYRRGAIYAANAEAGSTVTELVYMNGTTDYVELWCFYSSNNFTTLTGTNGCYFSGALISSANSGVPTTYITGTLAGDYTTSSAAYATMGVMSVSIPASVGDIIEVEFNAVAYTTTVGSINSDFGLYVGSTIFANSNENFNNQNAARTTVVRGRRVIVAGDLSGGSATFSIKWKTNTGGSTIGVGNSGTNLPILTVKNFGDGSGVPAKAFPAVLPSGRLTLTTTVPLTTSDVTGATTIYYTPYTGNQIQLWDGANWTAYTFTETSLALGTKTSALPYDVFARQVSGVVTLDDLVWTNTTTRATGISLQDGRYCLTGDKTRLYLGTYYRTSTTTTEDSVLKRFLWNCYNQQPREMVVADSTASWTYAVVNTWRQARATTSNKVECVMGLSQLVEATVQCNSSTSAAGVNCAVGIGVNSTTVNSAQLAGGGSSTTFALQNISVFASPLAVGYNALNWLEIIGAASTFTFYGPNGTDRTFFKNGIVGVVRA